MNEIDGTRTPVETETRRRSVGDLLREADPKELAEVWAKSEFVLDAEDERNGALLAEDAEEKEDFIRRLAETTEKRNDSLVILAVPEFSGDEEILNAELFERKELEETDLDGIEVPDGRDFDEAFEFAKRTVEALPTAKSFILEPWDEILGYGIDEGNAKEKGVDRLLSATLSSASYFGMESEDLKNEERKELERRAELTKKLLAGTADPSEGRFVSASEAKKSLGYSDGATPDSAEMRAAYGKITEKVCRNLAARMREIRKYRERNLSKAEGNGGLKTK